MRVASKVGNFHSEFGHTRPIGLRVLQLFAMYATHGRTDGRTNANLTAPFLRAGHNKTIDVLQSNTYVDNSK